MPSHAAQHSGRYAPRRMTNAAVDASSTEQDDNIRLVDAALILFIFIASYAANPLRAYAVERLAWIAADVGVIACFLSQPRPFLKLMRNNMILFSWPALACLSVIWSLTPVFSFYRGTQLFMTLLVGCFFCIYVGLGRTLKLIFIALLLAAGLSLLFVIAKPEGATAPMGEWFGVFSDKNTFGHMMALLIFTGLCLFLRGWWRLLTGPAILFATALLLRSTSGVALVAVIIVLAAMLLVSLFGRSPAKFTFGLGLILTLFAAALFATEISNFDALAFAFNALGKNSTLTGRTDLWDFGIEAYKSRPWLGFGYKAWWESSETAATLLRVVVAQDLWFFHNSFLEAAVAFGTMGPILLALGLGAGLVSALAAFAADPQFTKLWAVLFIVSVTVLACAENPLFQEHSIHQLLLVVAVAGVKAR
jgi:exopolysaccharide production protein ExoQ